MYRNAKLSVASLISLLAFVVLTTTAIADTRTTEDYIAVVFEAEDHASADERWVLTEPTTPQQSDDPDANHSDQAVGSAYLELLPDIRVTHADLFGPPTAFWGAPGAGPELSYPLDFPEAGRYYVHARAYSTGTEDNGIHVGLDDSWPASGAKLQFCTAGKGWSWGSRQRGAAGHDCGVEKTIWLTVPTAGIHTVQFSAREDGFELDRVMLIKDLSDNTRICSPSGTDEIQCVNGSLENKDEVVDLDVLLEAPVLAGRVDDQFDITSSLWNRDKFDSANNVEMTFELDLGTRWELVSQHSSCQKTGTDMTCSIGQVGRTFEGEEQIFNFKLQPLQIGKLSVPVNVTTSSVDGDTSNNTDSLQINVAAAETGPILRASLTDSGAVVDTGTIVNLVASIGNTGDKAATSVIASVSVPAGVQVSQRPADCIGEQNLICTLGELDIDELKTLNFGVTIDKPSIYSMSVSFRSDNVEDEDINATSILVAVYPPPEEPDSSELKGKNDSGAGSLGYLLGLWLFGAVTLRRYRRGCIH